MEEDKEESITFGEALKRMEASDPEVYNKCKTIITKLLQDTYAYKTDNKTEGLGEQSSEVS